MKRLWLCAAAAGALLTSSSTFAADTPASPPPASLAAPRMGPWGFDLSARDPSVKPGDDFFRYANGKGSTP